MLRTLEADSVSVCVTSPPYFGLRAYSTNPQVWGGDPSHKHEWQAGTVRGQSGGTASAKVQIKGSANFQITPDRPYASCPCGAWLGELGSEPSPEQFIANLVEVFQEVKRVLHPSGTLFLNLGDSYAGSGKGPSNSLQRPCSSLNNRQLAAGAAPTQWQSIGAGYKAKDLMLMPFRVALALQADGWWLRSAITWCKAAPMPESVLDRPTSATEMIFLLSKSARYFYDADAVREVYKPASLERFQSDFKAYGAEHPHGAKHGTARDGGTIEANPAGRNLWNYWVLPPSPYSEAHFATFPPEIPRRAILAGTSERGCCPTCGAPWKRLVERTHYGDRRGHDQAAVMGMSRNNLGGQKFYEQEYVPPKSVGWTPTCRHDAEPVPAVVLDCFSGAGTTGLVADRLGRDYIGIELNPVYAELSRKRLAGDCPMFADVEVAG